MISSAKQTIAISRLVILDTCKMPGRDLVTAQRNRHPVKRRKFQTRIARHTRYRRFPAQITRDKRLDHVAFEVFLKIQNIEWKSEALGDSPCIINIIKRAATRRQRVTVLIDTYPTPLIPQLHGKADEIMPLLLEKRSGCRTVDPATHCYCDLHNSYVVYSDRLNAIDATRTAFADLENRNPDVRV